MRQRDPAFAAHMAERERAEQMDQARRTMGVTATATGKASVYARLTAGTPGAPEVFRFHVYECDPERDARDPESRRSREISSHDRPEGFATSDEAYEWVMHRVLNGRRVFMLGLGQAHELKTE